MLIWDGAERLLWEYLNPASVFGESPSHLSKKHQERARHCIEPRVAHFLRAFTNQIHSRLLIISRVPFADLERGLVAERELEGLDPDAAVQFLRQRGVRGSEFQLKRKESDYAFHPLSLSNLAASVTGDYESHGSINLAPRFDPGIPMYKRRRHVLKIAFDKRTPLLKELLSRIAALRGVICIDVINHLTGDMDRAATQHIGPSLTELSRHGLIRASDNVFDMHPLVRGYAYKRLKEKSKVHDSLSKYHRSVQQTLKRRDATQRDWVEDATNFFYHTVRAGRHMEAVRFFKAQNDDPKVRNLNHVLYYELCDYLTFIQLLSELFPCGLESAPAVDESWISPVCNDIALAYVKIGEPYRADTLLKSGVTFARKVRRRYASDPGYLSAVNAQLALCLESLADVRMRLGKLSVAYRNVTESFETYYSSNRERDIAYAARVLGSLLTVLGRHKQFDKFVGDVRNISTAASPGESFYDALFAEEFLSRDDPNTARRYVNSAKNRSDESAKWLPWFQVWMDCIEGEVVLGLGEIDTAKGHFEPTYKRARSLSLFELELRSILDLGRVLLSKSSYAREGDAEKLRGEAEALALQALDDAKRSGFVLIQADVHNFLAELALSKHDRKAAEKNADLARILSSCGLKRPNRSSFYYARGYREAMRHLASLGV